MIFPGAVLVAARGSALPVSYRKLGSANGNRTCIAPVQLGPTRSKCLQIRASGMAAEAPRPLRIPDVAPRWHLAGLTLAVFRAPGAHVRAGSARQNSLRL